MRVTVGRLDGACLVVHDPAVLQAISHPARLVVLTQFLGRRELTASECAPIAGTSASAMSYHLRVLAGCGVLARVDSADHREHRWRLADAAPVALSRCPDGAWPISD